MSHAQADNSLVLLSLYAHSALPRPAQVALTLRAVNGLSTAEIAAAFLVPRGPRWIPSTPKRPRAELVTGSAPKFLPHRLG